MGFYEQNPGAKQAFADAGAQHDSGGATASTQTPATANDPGNSDPFYKAVAAGVPDGELNLMFNPANADRPAGLPDGSSAGWGGGGMTPMPGTHYTNNGNPFSASGASGNVAIPDGFSEPGSNPFSQSGSSGMIQQFSGGGAVGYDDGGDVSEDDLDAALQAVTASFDYGKQKHGLGGQQQASAIPMAPGSQSNSGAPRQLPAPGPLPPTNNPFGKRNTPFPAGAGQSSQADDTDDEETA